MRSPWRALLEDIELMSQHQDLGFQLLSRLEAVTQHADEQEAKCNHAAIMFRFADGESIGQSFRKRQSYRLLPGDAVSRTNGDVPRYSHDTP
jgi:hypothetical protein